MNQIPPATVYYTFAEWRPGLQRDPLSPPVFYAIYSTFEKLGFCKCVCKLTNMVPYCVISSVRVRICSSSLRPLYIWLKREQVHFLLRLLLLCWIFYVLSPLDITICIMLWIKRDWLFHNTFFLCHHWTACLFILCSSQCKNTFVRCCSVALLSGLVWGWSSFCCYWWAVWTCWSVPVMHFL